MSSSSSPEAETLETKPKLTANSRKKKPLWFRVGRFFFWSTCLLILLGGILWWQRILLAQWALESYAQRQGWQAQVQIDELDFSQGSRLTLRAEREGATLALQDLQLVWQWSLSGQEQSLELQNMAADSAQLSWNQKLLSWEELSQLGAKQAEQGEGSEEESEAKSEENLNWKGEGSQAPTRFALAKDFTLRVNELELELEAEHEGKDLSAHWQSAAELAFDPAQQESWELLLLKPEFALRHAEFGLLQSQQAESLTIAQNPAVGQSLRALGLQLQLSSLPAAVPFSELLWQGEASLKLSEKNTQSLKLEGKLKSPAVAELGLSKLELAHQIQVQLVETQLEEASARFVAKPFDWNEQRLNGQAQAALIWEQGKLSALSLELEAADPSEPELPWKLLLNGAGQEQQGILNFLLAQGTQPPLRGEGSWRKQGWQLELEGQVPLAPRWFAPVLAQVLPASSPLQLELTESSLLRLQNFSLGGEKTQLKHANGQVQVRDLAVQLDVYDAGWARAEAELSWLPDKGVFIPQFALDLPALQARGALLFSQAQGVKKEQDSLQLAAVIPPRPAQLKGWGWQIQVHELGPFRQYHPALETLDGNAYVHSALVSLRLPLSEGDLPEFHLTGQLARAELNSFEPLYSLNGIRAPEFSFRYGSPQPSRAEPQELDLLETQDPFWELNLPLIGIAEANIQDKLELNELRSAAQLRPQELQLGGLQLQAFDGKVWLDAARVPLPKGKWGSTLRWEKIDLAQIAALIPNFEGSLEGRIDGYLPLAFEGFRLKKEFQGGLSLSPGVEARMSAKPQGILALGGHPQAERAEAILEDYLVRELNGVLLPAEDRRTLMRLEFRGEGRNNLGELNLNPHVTTDQPELMGSLWKWVSTFIEKLELN